MPSLRSYNSATKTQSNTHETDGKYDARNDCVTLLFCASDRSVDDQEEGEFARLMVRPPGLIEGQAGNRDAITAVPPMAAEKGPQSDSISRSPVSEVNVKLQIPSLARTRAQKSHGGSMFQKRRTRGIAREKQDSTKRVTESREIGSPLGEKAHLLQDVAEAVRLIFENDQFPQKKLVVNKKPKDGGHLSQIRINWYKNI